MKLIRGLLAVAVLTFSTAPAWADSPRPGAQPMTWPPIVCGTC